MRSVHGEFKKWPSTTKSHVMTQQLPELWAGVDVFSATTDCAAEMVKTSRLLKDGKVADNDWPALPALNILWNGCAGHRLDKMYVIIAKQPDLEGLMHKLDASRVGGFGEGNSGVDFGDRVFRDKVWQWFKRVRGGLGRPFSPTS